MRGAGTMGHSGEKYAQTAPEQGLLDVTKPGCPCH